MLFIIQVINHMMLNLEYDESEVRAAFRSVIDGEITIDAMLNSILVEFRTPYQREAMLRALPKFESALHVVKMRNEVAS